MDAGRVHHQGMSESPDAMIFCERPNGTARRQNDQIERGAIRKKWKILQAMSRSIELRQKIAVRSHLLGTLAGVEKRGVRSLMRRAHRDQRFAALMAAELLQVVARDQTAHAVSNHVKSRFLAPALFDFLLQLSGEWLQARAGITRLERGNQAIVALLFQFAFQKKKTVPLLKNAMDQDDARRRAGLTGLHRGGADGREQSRHDPTFHDVSLLWSSSDVNVGEWSSFHLDCWQKQIARRRCRCLNHQ